MQLHVKGLCDILMYVTLGFCCLRLWDDYSIPMEYVLIRYSKPLRKVNVDSAAFLASLLITRCRSVQQARRAPFSAISTMAAVLQSRLGCCHLFHVPPQKPQDARGLWPRQMFASCDDQPPAPEPVPHSRPSLEARHRPLRTGRARRPFHTGTLAAGGRNAAAACRPSSGTCRPRALIARRLYAFGAVGITISRARRGRLLRHRRRPVRRSRLCFLGSLSLVNSARVPQRA